MKDGPTCVRRHARVVFIAIALCAAIAGHAAAGNAGAPTGAAASAPQGAVRRLTESQYRNSIADIFGADIQVVGRMEPDSRRDGLIAEGAGVVSVTPSAFDQYDDVARGIADQVTDPARRARLIGCGPGAQDRDGAECARNFFRRVGLRLYRRPLDAAEGQLFAGVAVAGGQRLGDYYAGVAAVLAGMLTSPEALFRIDAPGTNPATVDGYSKASRLSYLLWNTTPDADLLAAAEKGDLDGDAGLARQVDRLMASARFHEGMRAFFNDFLELDDLESITKDSVIYPEFSASVASDLREQTLRTIEDLLLARKGDYRDLFTTRRIAMTRELGPIYQVPVLGDGWTMYEFAEGDPRVGLLTQASLLALHSHPGRTSPTLRGKFIRETLLCQKIPSPPANVNFAVVQDVNNPTLRTTRARLAAHLDDEECASCHKKMDPIGLGLETFDGVGQFRAVENGDTIDASGIFDKAHFADAAELGRLFHDDPRVPACLVSTAWRYAAGRSEGPGDQTDIDALQAQFKADGYHVVDLIRQIALDPALYAWQPGAGKAADPASAIQGKQPI